MGFVLEVKNLSYVFPNGVGITDIGFQIDCNDIYYLYGSHNSGKSLILQSVLGIISPQKGSIKFFENPDLLQEKRRIGYVPQNTYYIDRMTIADMINYFSLAFGVLEKNFVEILNINPKEKKPVRCLPVFTQRKLNLWIALLGNPDLVCIDDIFGGLDMQESDELISIVSNLNKNNNITFLLTGNNYELASRIATKYGVLKNGRFLMELTPEKINDECKRCIKIRTPQLLSAIPLLEKEFPQYEVLEDDLIRVFCPLSYSAKLNTLLVSAGIEVAEIWIAGAVPQEYLLNLTEEGK
ncbi:MAG: ATP-binding cassette domain-containing protein [Lachnospiraceae bacterium]|nr:ATP-binding cassette domain-containing protein [Lachnospiraceae bacterium]